MIILNCQGIPIVIVCKEVSEKNFLQQTLQTNMNGRNISCKLTQYNADNDKTITKSS
jgi:hypothetical protein